MEYLGVVRSSNRLRLISKRSTIVYFLIPCEAVYLCQPSPLDEASVPTRASGSPHEHEVTQHRSAGVQYSLEPVNLPATRRAISAGAWSGMAKTELTLISQRTYVSSPAAVRGP